MKVAIGYVHPVMVAAWFMDSVLKTVSRSAREGNSVDIISVYSGVNISDARNKVVREFLVKSEADWLFMTDTDMVFADDAVFRLIARDRAVISGCCRTGDGGPSLYRTVNLLGRDRLVAAWPDSGGGLMGVDAVGAACLLVHRGVYRAVLARKFSVAAPWFEEVNDGESLVGEDITFCRRVTECGYQIFADTSVHAGHVKSEIIGEVR